MSKNSLVFILDLGIGNIFSIVRMIEKVGGRAELLNHCPKLESKTKLILPGVGHFDYGMRALKDKGLDRDFFNEFLGCDGMILGICLGMQLLCRGSEEGAEPGLGLIDADVKRFSFPAKENLKIPHMGWNVVGWAASNRLLPPTKEDQRYYFVHSYQVVPDDPSIVIGTANYGGEFCAAFQKENIYGVQFHPEKSHRFGMAFMKRFLNL